MSMPCWKGQPITPGWWWLRFSDGLGPRYWDGTFWARGSIFVGAEDYAEFPIEGPCSPPDTAAKLAQYEAVLNQIAGCESHAPGDVVDLARKAIGRG